MNLNQPNYPRQVHVRSPQGEMADAVAQHIANQATPRTDGSRHPLVNHGTLTNAQNELADPGRYCDPGV